jgi:ADP-ribosyl-[dinitrogen reductase] hydrolase
MGMGYTLKTMQVGLWSISTELNFEQTLIQIASAGGDTDTNAAVAGPVLGGRHGLSAIPHRWIKCVTDTDRLVNLADGLLAAELQ